MDNVREAIEKLSSNDIQYSERKELGMAFINSLEKSINTYSYDAYSYAERRGLERISMTIMLLIELTKADFDITIKEQNVFDYGVSLNMYIDITAPKAISYDTLPNEIKTIVGDYKDKIAYLRENVEIDKKIQMYFEMQEQKIKNPAFMYVMKDRFTSSGNNKPIKKHITALRKIGFKENITVKDIYEALRILYYTFFLSVSYIIERKNNKGVNITGYQDAYNLFKDCFIYD